jgi:linoleoyl-CoA desaturase
MSTVRFAPRSEFHKELKRRVNDWFEEHQLRKNGGWRWHIKWMVAVCVFLGGYGILLAADVWWTVLLGGVGVYLGSVFLAFNVMHDGAHGSATKSARWNHLAGSAMELLGGSQLLWRLKHNQMHHTYTNVVGKDDDLDVGVLMRLSKYQPWRPLHRLQVIYAWGLYACLSLYMIATDIQKMVKKRIGAQRIESLSSKQVVWFWMAKGLYLSYALILPALVHGLWPAVLGFLILHACFGFTLALVFQLAHISSDVMTSDETAKMEDDWAEHQIKTTVDFATRNKWLTWCVGGLNFQVEHHLFHQISHVHYVKLQKIVSKTCEEFKVPYQCYPSFWRAVVAHMRQLYLLGRRPA